MPSDSSPSTLEHRVRVQLRWRDGDMLGHPHQFVGETERAALA